MSDIQIVILEIYKVIRQICKKHNIPFYAVGGTCIGAVRHQGFIPWDDDLDIAIPIEYYDHLCEYLKQELPDYYELRTCKDVKHTAYIFAKVVDKRTTYIERTEFNTTDAYKGVFIDIMPMSGIPASVPGRWLFHHRLVALSTLNGYLRWETGENNSCVKKLLHGVLSMLHKDNFSYYSDKWMKMLRKHPFYQAKVTGYTWFSTMKRKKLTYPTEWFITTVTVPFEDTDMDCPQNYDAYLTKQFGNYMQLPPKEKQVSNHYGVYDLHTPYTYFIEHVDALKELIEK